MMLLAIAMAFAQPIPLAQYKCDAPTYASWTTKYIGNAKIIVPGNLIWSVRSDRRTRAIRMLATKSAVLLDEAQAAAMAGFVAKPENFVTPPSRITSPKRDPNDRVVRKPYLVRAVFPGNSPQISVGWIRDTLVVSAEALGCQPFFNEPLIIWLHQPPATVAVNPGAAL